MRSEPWIDSLLRVALIGLGILFVIAAIVTTFIR
jgi:hypothetical protein